MSDFALSEQLDQAIAVLLAGAADSGLADPALADLVEIARSLRDLPDEGFKTRLGAEIQRRTVMAASTPIERTPDELTAPGFAAIHSVMPFISVPEGAKLIDFLKHTFDAQETARNPHGAGGGFVSSVRIGDSDLLVMGDESARGRELLAALHVYVKDCDAVYQRALDAGAVTNGPPGVGEPADRAWGERAAFVIDPLGNYWNIATRAGVSPGHITPALLPSKASPLIEFLKRAFGAEEVGQRHEAGGRIAHAFVRIGGAMFELSEANEEGLRPFGFYLFTDDVDSVYHSAVAAGATSIAPPADQVFGDRIAVFLDPFGNQWIPAKRIVQS